VSPSSKRGSRRPRLRRHGLDGVELLAAHQVHPTENVLELLAHAGFHLVAHTGERAERTRGDAREIIE